jgi:hypothetical protein
MSKTSRTPQKPKMYQAKIKKEKSFKIHKVTPTKKIKHKKKYYDSSE